MIALKWAISIVGFLGGSYLIFLAIKSNNVRSGNLFQEIFNNRNLRDKSKFQLFFEGFLGIILSIIVMVFFI